MSAFCGLDFGTSNSAVGLYHQSGYRLVPLDGDKPIIRSAIFCDAEEQEWVFGQPGIQRYLEATPGRLMMALKTVLGSSLMDDKTVIFNEYIPYTSVLSHFLAYLKMKAEKIAEKELTQVVLGRPVHFHDTDLEKDRYAQNTLEKMAHDIGFKQVTFQYEPIAAALAYETTIQQEQLALIVDMGGGTSDFTVIQLHPNQTQADRASDVLANTGIHIAGTDFDKRLSIHSVMPLLGMGSLMKGASNDIDVPSSFYYDLTTWHTLTNLYSNTTLSRIKTIESLAYEKHKIARLLDVLKSRGGHHILNSVEQGKQQLSDVSTVKLDLDFIESDLNVLLSQLVFNDIIHDDLENIVNTVKQTIQLAGIHFSDINAIFYTGGSTKIPVFRDRINALFPQAEIVQGDAFGSVGIGLTIDAKRKFA